MKLLHSILFAKLLIVSSLCWAQSSSSAKLKIGMLLPLTGSYASGGVDNQRGIEAAIALSKSTSPIEIVYADSKADPVTGLNEFRKLTGTQHVSEVYVMRGSVGMPLNPISQSQQIPLLAGAGNKDFTVGNKYAFQVWSKSDDEGAFLAQVFKNRGYESAALVTVQDDWQSSVSDAFQSAMKRLGMKIVSSHEELPGESDFRSILLKIKTAAPKAVFANLGVQQIAGFLRQAKDLGLATQIYSNFWVAKKDVLEAAGVDLLDGVRFIEMDTDLPSLKKFIWEKYSATPSGATLSAYASMLLLLQAVSQKPGILSKEALYQELVKQTEISTPDGAIRIIDRRVQFPLKEKLLKAGKVVLADGA